MAGAIVSHLANLMPNDDMLSLAVLLFAAAAVVALMHRSELPIVVKFACCSLKMLKHDRKTNINRPKGAVPTSRGVYTYQYAEVEEVPKSKKCEQDVEVSLAWEAKPCNLYLNHKGGIA